MQPDTTPPTTVLDDAGTDPSPVSTTTTTSDAKAPATAGAEDADIAPLTETAPPSTGECRGATCPTSPSPALGVDVDVSTATAPSGVRSTRSPAADPIKHKYEITVKITTVKGQTKIDKWEFTAHGNPCPHYRGRVVNRPRRKPRLVL